MQVLLTPQAERDLEEIADFIAIDNPARALSFINEIRQRLARIAAAPLAYPARSELGERLRSCPHGRYVILFQPAEDAVLIVRVLQGARDFRRLLPEAE